MTRVRRTPLISRIAGTLVPSRFSSVAPADVNQPMAAVTYDKHGPPEVLRYGENVPGPRKINGQTLIRVRAAGLNPVDYKMRTFNIPGSVYPLPKIPGTDVAGEVIATDSTSDFNVGDNVFGMMPLLGTTWGACAKYASVADRFLTLAPKSIDFVGAASLPLVSLTVMQALRRAGVVDRTSGEGKRILIQAGSGGVGTFAVQYCATALGMEVAATCSEGNADLVRSLGARTIINYHTESFTDHIQGYDLVLDPMGHRNAERTLRSGVLRRGGHYIHIAGSDWPPSQVGRLIPEATPSRLVTMFVRQTLRNVKTTMGIGEHYYHVVFVHPGGKLLRRAANCVELGQIAPVIDRTFPLRETAEAHRYLEAGHAKGKVVITID